VTLKKTEMVNVMVTGAVWAVLKKEYSSGFILLGFNYL
jgi:hypothetical protein